MKEILKCPKCDGENIHHGDTHIYNRDFEDSEIGLHATITGTSLSTELQLDGNVSPRRNGMKILFSCEHCEHEPVLKIYQHKGATFMELV